MMPETVPQTLQDRLAGALDWWREAGVDHAFADEARSWVAKAVGPEPAPDVAAKPEPAPRLRIGGERAAWPAELAAFRGWWLADSSLVPGPLAERVAPRGPAQARLMLVVEHPEREDRERLLSGREGKLLDAFLIAAGIAPEATYVASALPRCTPLPDWPALDRDGLGDLLMHHLALAAPRRVILFGSNLPPLLHHDPAQNSLILPAVNHQGGQVPVLVAPSLATMLSRPKLKRGLWERWLDWTK
jgi:DNA polymerase